MTKTPEPKRPPNPTSHPVPDRPVPPPRPSKGPHRFTGWMTPADVADATGMHVTNVRKALEAGDLHGHQNCKGGRWRIHPDAVDALIRGTDTREACCGSNVIRLRRKTA